MDFYWTKSGGEQAQTVDARLEWWEKTENSLNVVHNFKVMNNQLKYIY